MQNFLRGNPSLDDTIRRLQAYAEAGADVLMAPGLPDLAAVRAVCAAVSKPVKGTAAVAHPPYHGVHAHPHVHSGDNSHGGLSDRYAAEAG